MRPYSDDLRGRVVSGMECGMTCREASERFLVAPSTAGNWHRLWKARKSYAPLPIGGDRRSKLREELGWISERLASVPDLTLAEVRHDLAARGVEVSYAGVQRTVRRLGLRFKKNDICD